MRRHTQRIVPHFQLRSGSVPAFTGTCGAEDLSGAVVQIALLHRGVVECTAIRCDCRSSIVVTVIDASLNTIGARPDAARVLFGDEQLIVLFARSGVFGKRRITAAGRGEDELRTLSRKGTGKVAPRRVKQLRFSYLEAKAIFGELLFLL